MGLRRYLVSKTAWYLGALLVAVVLNFLLPRLIPGNPVDVIVSQLGRGGMSSEAQAAIYQQFLEQFGLDKPLWDQFWIYVTHALQGNLGLSFSFYPTPVSDLISQSLPFTLVLQIPAIILGWIIGNLLGAVAAYKGGSWDKSVFTTSLVFNSMPYYCLSIILLYGLAVVLGWFPPGGAYSLGNSPEWSWDFFSDALQYWWLPFLSLLLINIGGQAVGMRSMAIYELGSDYVNYSRSLGIGDRKMTGYIFRNAMLPQITGLALSIGTMVGGALITELVFNYPGMGTLLFSAISANDYPIVQAVTLIITVAVLVANYLVEVLYGFIDPRIRAAKSGEK
ncbi:MAG: ABC transporter permease [Propionibacteriaceae bacterium]|jgi:peptide/nickel transport system permease protein|nr:ABC transporter permease [Propionibacteriaceae bacterium]